MIFVVVSLKKKSVNETSNVKMKEKLDSQKMFTKK